MADNFLCVALYFPNPELAAYCHCMAFLGDVTQSLRLVTSINRIPGEYQRPGLNAGSSLINYIIFNPHFHILEKEEVGLNYLSLAALTRIL